MATKGKPSGTGNSSESRPSAAGDSDRNSIDRAKPRERKRPVENAPAPEAVLEARRPKVINSISVPHSVETRSKGRAEAEPQPASQDGRARGVGRAEKSPEQNAPADIEDHSTVPDHIRWRFVQVGRRYYFPDGARAFTDRGRRLTTPSENTEVIRSLVSIAKARGWGEIVVRGTDSFRREAWFVARLQGIEVRGYRPTDVEQARLVRTLGRTANPGEQRAESEAQSPPRVRRKAASAVDGLLAGKLLGHGRAPFQQDPRQPMSYFAKIQTGQGERTIWGVDLERAFKEAVTKPELGDLVGLRSVRQDSVTVKAPKRDQSGAVIGEQDVNALRNRWIVEKAEFFAERQVAAETVRDPRISAKEAVKARPELTGTYLQIRAAELAAKKIADPRDQAKFVSAVRSNLADSVARGDPPARVRLREPAPKRVPPKSREARAADRAAVRT